MNEEIFKLLNSRVGFDAWWDEIGTESMLERFKRLDGFYMREAIILTVILVVFVLIIICLYE